MIRQWMRTQEGQQLSMVDNLRVSQRLFCPVLLVNASCPVSCSRQSSPSLAVFSQGPHILPSFSLGWKCLPRNIHVWSRQALRQLASTFLSGPCLFLLTAAQNRGTRSETVLRTREPTAVESPLLVPLSRSPFSWDSCSAFGTEQCSPHFLPIDPAPTFLPKQQSQ